MLVYKIVRKIDGRYFSLYGEHFPRLNLEYKIGERTTPTHGKIFVYPSVGYWHEYKPCHSVLLCSAPRVYTGSVKAYNLELVELAVLDREPHPLSTIMDAALCDSVTPIKELSHTELLSLFTIHNDIINADRVLHQIR